MLRSRAARNWEKVFFEMVSFLDGGRYSVTGPKWSACISPVMARLVGSHRYTITYNIFLVPYINFVEFKKKFIFLKSYQIWDYASGFHYNILHILALISKTLRIRIFPEGTNWDPGTSTLLGKIRILP